MDRVPVKRPLLGFGRFGWAALAVLAIMIVLCVFRYELLYAAQVWVNGSRGPRALMTLTYSMHFLGSGYQLRVSPENPFYLSSMMLIAMFFHPFVRFRASAVLLVLWPFLINLYIWFQWFELYKYNFIRLPEIILGALLFVIVSWRATRSKEVMGALLVLVLLTDIRYYISTNLAWWFHPTIDSAINQIVYWNSGVVWYVLFAVVLGRWVVSGRRLSASSCCWKCRYDLTAHNPAKPCPECGNEIPEDHPLRAPLAVAGEKPSASTA